MFDNGAIYLIVVYLPLTSLCLQIKARMYLKRLLMLFQVLFFVPYGRLVTHKPPRQNKPG